MQRFRTALTVVSVWALFGLGACTVHHHHQGQQAAYPTASGTPVYTNQNHHVADQATGAPGYDQPTDPYAEYEATPSTPAAPPAADHDCDCSRCGYHSNGYSRSDSYTRSYARPAPPAPPAARAPRGPVSPAQLVPSDPADWLE